MINDLKPLLSKFMVFAKDRLNFRYPPKLFLKKDTENSNCMLGRTAHYDPNESGITLYTSGRHPKDIMRSLAHELVHHCQNERGDLAPEKMKTMNQNYAQENDHMRKMEEEAYLQGNMCFRDWEDGLDDKLKYKMHIAEHKFLKENKNMSVKITKQFLKKTISEILDQKLIGEQERGGDFQGNQSHLKQVIRAYSEGGMSAAKKKAKEIIKSKTSNLSNTEVGSFASKLLKKAKNDYPDEYDEAVAAYRGKNKTQVAPQQKQVPQEESLEEGEVPAGLKKYQDKQAEKAGKTSSEAPMSVGADGEDPEKEKEKVCPEGKKIFKGHEDKGCQANSWAPSTASEGKVMNPEDWEKLKLSTPEGAKALYESRFTKKNTRLFEKLLKEWAK
jgi:hypothetical protein